MSKTDINKIQKLCGLTGTIQRDIISSLSRLSGYAKRRELLEAELIKSGHSASGITQSIGRLLSIGLLTEKPNSNGVRISLTKAVWDVEPKVVNAIIKATLILAEGKKSNTQAKSVISEVRKELSELIGENRMVLYKTFVNVALLSMAGWELEAGLVQRVSAHKTKPKPKLKSTLKKPTETFKNPQLSLTQNTKKFIDPVVQTPDDIELLSFDTKAIAKAILTELSNSDMKVSAHENLCTISATLPLGRMQKVHIAMRKDLMQRKVFWMYTLCGMLRGREKSLQQMLLDNNNECGPQRIALFSMGNEIILGCCAIVSADKGWERELPQVARVLSNLGDHLEEKYWGQDHF